MPARLREARSRVISRWIRVVSLLAPPADRADWLEEWQAELRASGHGIRDAWGALPDA
jgi:hypothetical protein